MKHVWVTVLVWEAGHWSPFLSVLIAVLSQQAPLLPEPLPLSDLRGPPAQRWFSSFGQLTLRVLFTCSVALGESALGLNFPFLEMGVKVGQRAP